MGMHGLSCTQLANGRETFLTKWLLNLCHSHSAWHTKLQFIQGRERPFLKCLRLRQKKKCQDYDPHVAKRDRHYSNSSQYSGHSYPPERLGTRARVLYPQAPQDKIIIPPLFFMPSLACPGTTSFSFCFPTSPGTSRLPSTRSAPLFPGATACSTTLLFTSSDTSACLGKQV